LYNNNHNNSHNHSSYNSNSFNKRYFCVNNNDNVKHH